MAKKRFKIRDKQGNPVDYDISAASVTIDVEGKSLEVKLSELVDAISRSVKSITFNGNSPTMDSNGNVNLGQQMQGDWTEANINWPSYIKNKPSFSRVATTGSYNDLSDKPTIPEGVATDSQMSDSSDAPVKNRVIKAYVDNLISGLVNGAPQALDTLNELSAALGNDANFAATITQQLANKANSADVYTKSQTYDKDEVDVLVASAGKVKSVTINGVTPPVDNNGNVNLGTIHDGVDGTTPHIGQDGYWYIGTTKTDTKAQGERGNDGVSSADECVVVNNLDGDPADLEEGQVAVLGADQGKELKMAIDSKGVSFKVEGDTLFIRTAASPMVNVLPTSIQFDDTIFGNTRTAVVHIYGRNLTNQVEVQVSGVGFSGSTTLLPDIDGKVDEDVTITFAPTASTGTEGDGGRSYDGSVTAVCEGAESASATLEGFGVQSIQPRITATIDNAALKGVLDTTAAGEYSSEPATATLHVQAMNINQAVTLAVDTAKFALSENQISVEDALRGKDITVTYLRQSEVTATDDEGTITITAAYDNTSIQSTVAVSGATAAKITSGTIGKINGLEYFYKNSIVFCKEDASNKPSGAVVIDTIYDEFGYQHSPKKIESTGFYNNQNITSLVIGDTITSIFSSAFDGCSGMTYLRFWYLEETRTGLFNRCSSLETVDMRGFTHSYADMFTGCKKLSKVIVRYDGAETTAPLSLNTAFDKNTAGTMYIYEDGNGVEHQKKLYVPSNRVSSYQNHTYWGLFEVHSIDELSE